MTYDELLARLPTNPVHALNYSTLHQLWKTAQSAVALEDGTEAKLKEWDELVQGLLTPSERAFYLSPFGNLDMSVTDFRMVSRLNHLTKILVHRQGIKTTNGFNG